ncbi:MFS transporter [Cellulomonas sp. Y8]|uniref:MFS transporter n=1 Tax=Cellulomonas sp. Y8 TaxID=2591145 RepID=UPI003D754104
MTAAPSPATPPDALAPGAPVPAPSGAPRPTAPVGAGFQSSLTFAFFGTWIALLPATQVTLALKVTQIDAEGRAAALSLVLGVGAFVALIAQNIFGALSDRTTSRFGMRRPWIAAGAILGVSSLFLLASASTIPMLVVAWACTQLTFNILLAGLNPVLPDQVPSSQLGKVSALVGMTQSLAAVGGAWFAQLFLPDLTKAIVIPGILTLVSVGILMVVLRDRTVPRGAAPRFRITTFLGAFWTNPRKAPDFALAWWSRFLVFCGNFTLASYQVYFLMDRFGYDNTAIGGKILQVTAVTTVCTIAASLLVGRISDRLQRRKMFVLISAVVLAVAHGLAAFAGTFEMFLAASAVAGLAIGVYLAVDSALIAEVLPSRADVGKDMGVLHLANVLPQTLVPVAAPVVLAIGGGGENYPALFVAGAIVGIIGAVVNQFIRSVR